MSNVQSQAVRVRIAPSPTGDPHVGTAYVALFNLIFARSQGGAFILRIEDTDQQRARVGSEAMILEGLKWLGLEWDEGPDCGGNSGPYRQSERTSIYREHADRLVASGHAYPCFCSSERLAEMRDLAKAEGRRITGYDGYCRSLAAEEVREQLKKNTPCVIRLRTPEEGQIAFCDFLRGEILIDNAQIDDQVLIKSDGFPTYHLANVVDDHLMAISHVIRAEEWIASTPKHILLYEAFGWEKPVFVHLPLLRNQDKSKISKRKNPVSINYYRQAGYLPRALLNFLGLMGWNHGEKGEIFSIDEMIERFELNQLTLGSPIFDIQKLRWLNGEYIRKLGAVEFVSSLKKELFCEQRLQQIFPLVRERLETFQDFITNNSFFFSGSLSYADLEVIPKGKSNQDFRKMLDGLLDRIDAADLWGELEIEQLLNDYQEAIDWKAKDFLMPLRLIATGRKDSPPLPGTLMVLGKEMLRFRIREYLAFMK